MVESTGSIAFGCCAFAIDPSWDEKDVEIYRLKHRIEHLERDLARAREETEQVTQIAEGMKVALEAAVEERARRDPDPPDPDDPSVGRFDFDVEHLVRSAKLIGWVVVFALAVLYVTGALT